MKKLVVIGLLAFASSPESVFAQQPLSPPSATQPTPAPPASALSLSAATAAALQQVSAFQQAQIEQAIAAEDVRQAEAALLPRARDSFTITYNSPAHPLTDPASPSFLAQNAIHEYQNLLGVTGEWNFGLIAAIRRSRALQTAARAGTEVARRAFVRGVNETYYSAALATAKRRASEQSLAAAEEFERVTALNQRAGEVPEIDVIRARLLTAARRDELAQARQAEAIANAALGTLLGLGIVQAPLIEPLPQQVDIHQIDSLTAAGVARRPEFAQLDARVRAAQADISVARASRLPRIVYSVDKGFDTNSLAIDELRQHRGVLAAANVDVPLFDWGVSRSRQRQAELRLRGAEVQRQIAIRDLYLQFATARQEAITAAERVENARQAVADAEHNMTTSISRYRAGEAPILEVTDAQTTLAVQRATLQQALHDYQIALGRLREAAGE
jgi:outer membrane protein TolC